MTVFSTVEIWPFSGHPGSRWCWHPDEDAFVKTARRVCELYGEGLAQARLPSRATALRLWTDRHTDGDETRVEIELHFVEGFEAGNVSLPAGVADLSPDARAGLVLDVVHGAVGSLAAARGWPADAVEAARTHAVASDLRFEWAGRWKASPSRRLEARAVYRLLDDGYGRAAIEVRERASGDLVGRSVEALAFSTVQGLRRSARTLRWNGSDVVELVPYAPPFDDDEDVLVLVWSGGVWLPNAEPAWTNPPRPRIVVVGSKNHSRATTG